MLSSVARTISARERHGIGEGGNEGSLKIHETPPLSKAKRSAAPRGLDAFSLQPLVWLTPLSRPRVTFSQPHLPRLSVSASCR